MRSINRDSNPIPRGSSVYSILPTKVPGRAGGVIHRGHALTCALVLPTPILVAQHVHILREALEHRGIGQVLDVALVM
jgi:hypothetical protein